MNTAVLVSTGSSSPLHDAEVLVPVPVLGRADLSAAAQRRLHSSAPGRGWGQRFIKTKMACCKLKLVPILTVLRTLKKFYMNAKK